MAAAAAARKEWRRVKGVRPKGGRGRIEKGAPVPPTGGPGKDTRRRPACPCAVRFTLKAAQTWAGDGSKADRKRTKIRLRPRAGPSGLCRGICLHPDLGWTELSALAHHRSLPAHNLFDETPLSSDPTAEASGDRSRISALPDEVLFRVLSHLRSHEAVHTCVLSRRWRDLWQSVPCIDVSFNEFADMADEDEDEDDFEPVVLFKKFVNRLLMLRRPVDLEEFRLEYSLPIGTVDLNANSADANLWIAHVLQYKARAVKVVTHNEYLQLVPAVFTSKHLKRLHICNAQLIRGFFERLKTGCPALEYLFLSDCNIMDHEIIFNTLKVLTLTEETTFSSTQSSISAPSLISLFMDECRSEARLPILKNMSSLETASVLLSGGYITTCDADGIRQFLRGLSDVRSLDFYYGDRQTQNETYGSMD
ncbi:hypothetical protein VPH35_138066 [Triticum aestivum]